MRNQKILYYRPTRCDSQKLKALFSPLKMPVQDPTKVSKVVVHPLVLLSVVDHFNRMGKVGNVKRVVGVLLGSNRQGVLDVSNSFAGQFTRINQFLKVANIPRACQAVICEFGHLESKSGSESRHLESESRRIRTTSIFLNPNPDPVTSNPNPERTQLVTEGPRWQ